MGSPGFFSLYNASRSIMAAQTGLNLVNQNIANAGTAGYTKQRVDLQVANPYQVPTLSSGGVLQIGQGVSVNALTRVRDGFLDSQYRAQNSLKGEVDFGDQIFKQLEGVVGEPTDTGLRTALQSLFDSVQDMTLHPESLSARTAFLQQASDTASLFNQLGTQLLDLHTNLVGTEATPTSFNGSQLGISVDQVNGYLNDIVNYNKQINTVTAAGGTPNDLLDQRDNLVEKLSREAGVDVTNLANNQISVSIGGQPVIRGVQLLDTLSLVVNTGANATEVPALLQTTTGAVDITNTLASGTIKGILDVAGNNPNISSVYSLFDQLNTMFETLSDEFNLIQQGGRDLNGAQHAAGADVYDNIFQTNASYPGSGPRLQYLVVNPNLLTSPGSLSLAADDATATANFAGVGDNRNALAMVALRNTTYAALGNKTVGSFHETLISKLGTDAKSYNNRNTSQNSLLQSLEGRRQSVSGVNIDEETVDLLRYQRAFEASSRVIKTMNEVYDLLIRLGE